MTDSEEKQRALDASMENEGNRDLTPMVQISVKDYDKLKEGKMCRHMVCVLPYRASCDAFEELIKSNNLIDNIFLLGKIDNVYPYMKNARALILPSLWEEPGFVIVEAAFSNLFVISSDCPNGPREFLNEGKAGYLFENNKKNALFSRLDSFKKEENNLRSLKIKAKKNSSNYTLLRHHINLKELLKNKDYNLYVAS